MQVINKKILSFDYKDYVVDIKTADAQKSYKEGVTVLVTGCLTGKDNLKRKFAQSFFLAPQDNGYYVLNDVFRYVEEVEQLESGTVNGVDAAAPPSTLLDIRTWQVCYLVSFVVYFTLNSYIVPKKIFAEPNHVPDPPAPDPATAHEDADQIVVEKAYDASEHERELVNEKKPVAEITSHSHANDVTVDVESSPAAALEDAPKKLYASIVNVPKGSLGPTQVYVPTNFLNVSSKKVENQPAESAAPASVPEASAPSSTGTPDSSNTNEEGKPLCCLSLTEWPCRQQLLQQLIVPNLLEMLWFQYYKILHSSPELVYRFYQV
ncbi:nuclear transport factor 2 isoform X1 [Ziziphus jujuba]|uniref:Nuclear transport factor 2 isoform X1 n=1 Tax=Ziziphus jujuba TaxID=326968 RepID=A0ABM3ITS1_ZIZJJ|nr:nuclear transport factor 2 isoform X1 [Ziziphus jujuba]